MAACSSSRLVPAGCDVYDTRMYLPRVPKARLRADYLGWSTPLLFHNLHYLMALNFAHASVLKRVGGILDNRVTIALIS